LSSGIKTLIAHGSKVKGLLESVESIGLLGFVESIEGAQQRQRAEISETRRRKSEVRSQQKRENSKLIADSEKARKLGGQEAIRPDKRKLMVQ
jgi:hypothetical protein